MLKTMLSLPLVQIAVLTALVLGATVSPLDPWATIENRNYDFWAGRFRHPETLPIAVVAIDERSIRQYGDWPWPRARVAELISLLSEQGAAAIGLCLLYTRSDLNPGMAAIQDLRERLNDPQWNGHRDTIDRFAAWLQESQRGLDQDAQLIRAVRSSRNVVLPIQILMDQPAGIEATDPSGMVIVNSLNPTILPTGATGRHWELAQSMGMVAQGPPAGSAVLEPFPALAGKAGALGHLNLNEDPDGRVRRIPLLIDFQGRLIPAFAFQLALKHLGGRLRDIAVELDLAGQPHLRIETLHLTLDGAYGMLLNHDRDWTRQRYFSSAEIFNGEIDPAVFRDQIVLIGVTAEPFAQSYRVGMNDRAAGVEIMANALAGLLAERRLSRPSWAWVLEIGIVLYLATFLALVIPRVTVSVGATILLIFMVTWYAATVGLLLGYGYKIDVMPPLILTLAGFLLLHVSLAARRLQTDRLEACKTLGLSFQGQGMLDMAHEKFMACSVKDRTVKHTFKFIDETDDPGDKTAKLKKSWIPGVYYTDE
jgi:serine/threonine-protein kinase